ncbi:MAG TPA: hypothetical protein PK252_06160 [Bacteroidales bacterium]|nr:hypothetical protein [Bacteroidales bacterium]
MENISKKICLHCQKPLEKGRSDRKFCDYYCRNAYNNQRTNESEKIIKTINQILRKNRTILRNLNPTGHSTVRKEYLVMQGFNFNHFTHRYVANNKNEYWFCYEYGYMFKALENEGDVEKVVIVNWQSYMAKPS